MNVLSFKHAINGIKETVKTERNMRFHLFAALFVIGVSWWSHFNNWQWCITLLCIGIVLAAEVLNTAIENTVDLITLEKHPKAKIAKDCAAGSVLILSCTAAAIWLYLLSTIYL